MRFKIDWASLVVRRKFTVFALLYYVFEGNFQVHPPRGGLYLEGRFNGGFFALRVWGAYIWRGLYMEGLIFEILRYLQSWTKVLGTVLQYSYFSVISRSPLKAVHPFRNFLAVLPPPPPPYTKLKLGKNLDTRVQHCLWDEGRGWTCVN